MADLEALGLIEHPPRVTEMGTDTCVIRVNAGRAFNTPAAAKVYWGPTAEDVGDNETPSPFLLSGLIKGDPVQLPIESGLTEGEPFYYQIEILTETEGSFFSDIIGPVIAGIVPASGIVRLSVISSAQHLHIVNNDNNGPDNRLDLFRKTIENVVSSQPHMVIGGGNNIWNVEEGSNMWPVDEDGATVAGDHYHFAQSQAQCEIACRLLARDMGSLLSTVPFLEVEGPAMGVEHWFAAANNGAINDLQAWAIAAIQAHYGNWADSDKFSGDPDGRYGSFDLGKVKICICSSQPETILRTTDPATVRTRPDNLDDHTWGQNEWDYFFDATTGVVTLADPDVTPWILFVSYNIVSGYTLFGIESPLGGVLNAIDKTAGRDSFEHGASSSWLNSYGYSGDYAALGIHKAIVARTKANGCQAIFAYSSARMYCYEVLDGIPYVCCGRPCGSRDSPWEYRDFTTGGYGTIAPTPLNLNRNAAYLGASGHVNFRATDGTFVIEYIRAYIPGLLGTGGSPVTEPPDGVAVNGAVAHRAVLSRPTKMRSLILAGGGTFATDSTTPAAAGSTQPSLLAGEPVGAVGEFGEGWQAFTAGSGDTEVYIRECVSTIDSAIVLATRRPITASVSAVRQSICARLDGIDREIKLKVRATGQLTTQTYLAIFARPVLLTPGAVNKGLFLQVGSVSGAIAFRLRFDDGVSETTIVDGSPVYECPEATDFDAGIIIRVRGRRLMAWADNGSGVLTLRIDTALDSAIYAAILSDPTMRYVGLGASTSNIAGNSGNITEWKDFFAKRLPR